MYSLSFSPIVGRSDIRAHIHSVPVGQFFRIDSGLLCMKRPGPSNSTMELWYDLDNCSTLIAQGSKIVGAIVSRSTDVEPLQIVSANIADAIPYDDMAQDVDFAPCLMRFGTVYIHRGTGIYEALNGEEPAKRIHDIVIRQTLIDNPHALTMGSELRLTFAQPRRR